MGKINDLSKGNLDKIWEAIRKLQYATSQNNMAVGRGGVTVYGGGGITIENGGLYVTGSATISGTLIAQGTIEMSGTFTATGTVRLSGQTDIWGPLTVTGDTDLDGVTTITGDTTVTGNFNVNGPMKTTGTLSVEGVTTLKSDLTVAAGGTIKFGDMTIDPSLLGGSIQFSGGGYLSGTTSGPQLTGPAGNAFVYSYNGQAGIQAADIRLAGAVEVQGGLKVTSPGTTTGVTANVYMDGSGNLKRILP